MLAATAGPPNGGEEGPESYPDPFPGATALTVTEGPSGR